MCSSKEKITKYTKKEENMAHSQKIKKAQTFELSVKDTAANCLKYVQRAKGNYGQRSERNQNNNI